MQLHPQPTAEMTDALPGARNETAHASGRRRRRFLWAGIGVLVLLLLAFLPPLINANRYRRQIARSMSESLGRPVHLDNVTLQILPVPGLTLSNLVVSEDPAFGDEPTIRADAVTGTLRLGSLWRRRVEFSTVRFIEPHVNLVRNAKGRWNLADVLLHASHVNTAPTAQRRAGPAPRFPYIEATGGRVNIKLDQEKLPFTVTDADFALWLPSPGHWRVRLRGQPTRTDTDLTDPGTLRLEGDLQRAATAADVQINLRASWHDAPMGEASRLLFAEDMGWRGTSNLEASLEGTLRTAQWRSQLTLSDLRRTEFAPAHPLDLQVTCSAALAIQTVTLADLLCTMPDEAPHPATLRAASLNLQHPSEAVVHFEADDIPAHWGLRWLALFSPRVSAEAQPSGSLQVHFAHENSLPPVERLLLPIQAKHARRGRPSIPPETAAWKGWTGEVQLVLPNNASPDVSDTTGSNRQQSNPGSTPEASSIAPSMVWRLVTTTSPRDGASTGSQPKDDVHGKRQTDADFESRPALRLQPTLVRLSPESEITAAGTILTTGYTFSANGNASAAALLQLARFVPQLGDGTESVLPYPPTNAAPTRVEFTCDRQWAASQTCTSSRAIGISGKPSPGVNFLNSGQGAPILLRPQSLSPLDHASALGNTRR